MQGLQRRLVLEFTKMHGAGNDFVVVDNRFYHFSDDELSGLARRLCPRRHSVGADGLLALAPPDGDGTAYRMRYVNADGSWATMCANGARCLARFAQQAGVASGRFAFASDAGRYEADVPDDPSAPVRLFVPAPERYRAEHALAQPVGPVEAAAYVWPGTEHVVVFVDDVYDVPVAAWGKAIRRDASLQPAGANVNFVEIDGAHEGRPRLRTRTFEKGVEAETLACGTGAVAVAYVARRQERVAADEVEVEMPGGVLRVGVGDEGCWLEGPAVHVFRATVEV